LILLIIIDYAWITGGGISVLLAVNLFIAIQIILAINDSKYYRTIFIILLANYFMLFSLEYFWQFNLASDFLVYKHDLVDQFIIWFFYISLAAY